MECTQTTPIKAKRMRLRALDDHAAGWMDLLHLKGYDPHALDEMARRTLAKDGCGCVVGQIYDGENYRPYDGMIYTCHECYAYARRLGNLAYVSHSPPDQRQRIAAFKKVLRGLNRHIHAHIREAKAEGTVFPADASGGYA